MKRAACVWMCNPQGQVLAVNRRQDPSLLCMPGGKCEEGETFIAAAVRETWEETGVRMPEEALTLVLRGPCESFPGGPSDHDVCAYAAQWQTDWGEPVQQEADIRPRWVSVDEFMTHAAMPAYNRNVLEAIEILDLFGLR